MKGSLVLARLAHLAYEPEQQSEPFPWVPKMAPESLRAGGIGVALPKRGQCGVETESSNCPFMALKCLQRGGGVKAASNNIVHISAHERVLIPSQLMNNWVLKMTLGDVPIIW